MTTKPEDIEFRQQALDISRSFIVKAPAGSGKTTLLVKRYLKLLATVNNPEEIIAITFTRKAAGELTARVIDALVQAPVEHNDKLMDHELIHIADKARQRGQEKGWNLIHNPSKIRIQTIDSLCNYIVMQMPWSAGFGAAPSTVSDDVSQLYLQAARQALIKALSAAEYKASADYVLMALDNDFSRAAALIKAMLARRDQWHGLLGQRTGDEARQFLQANWAYVAEHLLKNCATDIDPADQLEILSLGQYAANKLIEADIDSPIRILANQREFPSADIEHIPVWKAITALLLTADFKFRKSANVRIGFPPLNKGGEKTKKEEFMALLTRLGDKSLGPVLAQIATLPDSAYSQSEWQLLESLLSLLRMAQLELLDIFQQNSCCDHIEIADRAVLALGQGRQEGPSELALRLDYAIKHLLVDEFQDTSQSQMLLLNKLTAGWQGDDERTVFFVGDPMQSIYRFRQADVGLFLNIFNNGFDNTKINALTLTTNFRSSKPIVDWVNKAFSQIFPGRDDLQSGAVGYKYSKAHKLDARQNDRQTTHVVERHDEAEAVCKLILDLSKQDTDDSIAVLVRSRSHLADIVVALNNAAMDFQGVKIDQLKSRSCIQDIMALTAALVHFGDKLAWLAVLRAPWCGLSLPDLTLIAQNSSVNTVWQVINSPPQKLSKAAYLRLDHMLKVLSPIIASVGRQPLNQVVARAWHGLSGADTINTSEWVNINSYIQLLGEIEQAGGLSDLKQLDTAMDDLWAVSGNSSSKVQLMTIHAAKGLEFDVVILPGLARRPRSDDSKLLIWKEFVVNTQQSALLVSPIKQENEDARYRFVQSLEKQAEREEIKRLLYVAATRAVKQLHLFVSPFKTSQVDAGSHTGTSLQSFLQPVLTEICNQNDDFENNAQTAENEARTLTHDYFRLPIDHQPATYDQSLGMDVDETGNDLVEYTWVGVSARHEGTLMHEIICQMASGSAPDPVSNKKHWHNQLLSLGMQVDQINDSLNKIQAVVTHMIEDSRAQWILDNTHSEPKNEWQLSAMVNNRLENVIIDRTFIDEQGVRWIIDYKTSTHEGANVALFIDSEFERYRSQLEKYAAVMRFSESAPIKLGLYFPLLKAWREWDYAG